MDSESSGVHPKTRDGSAGFAWALISIGRVCSEGRHVEADEVLALDAFERALDLGEAAAHLEIGRLYEAGDDPAKMELGRVLVRGELVQQDVTRGSIYLKRRRLIATKERKEKSSLPSSDQLMIEVLYSEFSTRTQSDHQIESWTYTDSLGQFPAAGSTI